MLCSLQYQTIRKPFAVRPSIGCPAHFRCLIIAKARVIRRFQSKMNFNLPCLLKKHSGFLFNPTNSQTAETEPSHCQALFQDLLDDIENPRVRQLISSHVNLRSLLDSEAQRQSHLQHLEEVKNKQLFLKQFDERKWLTRKGKKYLIDFDNEERREMKQYFSSLDKKKCGSIGIDELEELLLSVGLLETREEIKALIDSVDQDKSGKIEFGQFLSMIQNDEGPNQEIVSFFKTVIGQNSKIKATKDDFKRRGGLKNPHKMPKSGLSDILQKHPYPKGLPFQMVVSHIRRKHMMTALNIGRSTALQSSKCYSQQNKNLLSSDQLECDNTLKQISKGQRVMQALQKMYERKLILQIKQSKRASNLTKTDQVKIRRTQSNPWGLFGRRTS